MSYKINFFILLGLVFILNMKIIHSQYYINETDAAISNKVKEYNYYANQFHNKTDIKVYFNLFILPKNTEYSEKFIQAKKKIY